MASCLVRLILTTWIISEKMVSSADISWRKDNVEFTTLERNLVSNSVLEYTFAYTADRSVLRAEAGGGHYRFEIDGEATACLDWHDKEETLENALNGLVLIRGRYGLVDNINGMPSNRVVAVTTEITASGNTRGYKHTIKFLNTTFETKKYNFINDNLELKTYANNGTCKPITTWGDWSDSTQWEGGGVPTEDDKAIIPDEIEGFVELTNDVVVKQLEQNGGTIVTMSSSCASGWAKPQGALYADGNWITKCYAPYFGPVGATGLSFEDAENFCGQVSPGARGHLARIETYVENEVVKELCMGLAELLSKEVSPDEPLAQVYDPGCWIGLSDLDGDGIWSWYAEEELTHMTVRSWARGEPNNKTTTIGGEACALMQPALYDIEAQHEGLWSDERCTSLFPFVCERFGESTPYTLEIEETYDWKGGTISGGGTVKAKGETTVYNNNEVPPGLTDGARLELHYNSQWTTGIFVEGGDGTSIVNYATMRIRGDVIFNATAGAGIETIADTRRGLQRKGTGILDYNSETSSTTFSHSQETIFITEPVEGGRRPKLENMEGSTIEFAPQNMQGDSTINFFLVNNGNLQSSSTQGNDLILGGGGRSDRNGTITVNTPGNDIIASDYSLVLAVAPSYILNVSAMREVTGEYQSPSDKYADTSNPDRTDSYALTPAQQIVHGTYRLRVGDDVTACIPYHASETTLQDKLNALDEVFSLGGVTVRRSGDPVSKRWNHGYMYTIVFDSFNNEAIDFKFDCQGQANCSCSDIVAEYPQNGNVRYFCNSSTDGTRPDLCLLDPDISVMMRHTGGESDVIGEGGKLASNGGLHRMPSNFVNAGLRVDNGNIYILSGSMSIPEVEVNSGVLVFGGTSFMGMDLAKKLYMDASADRREALIHRDFSGIISRRLDVNGGELRIVTASFNSGIEADTVYYSGGLLSGWSTIAATSSLYVTGDELKTMRSAMRLTCAKSCSGIWNGTGNVVLKEGSSWFVRGEMKYDVPPHTYESSDGDTTVDVSVSWDADRDGWAEGRQWSGNYWYTNPVCGPHCARAPYLLNTGIISVPVASQPMIGIAMRHLGGCKVSEGARLTLDGGGDGGGDWYIGGNVRLLGGRFVMDGDANVTSNEGVQGTLECASGGPHQTGDILYTRLVVSGGILEVKTRYFVLSEGLLITGGTILCSVSGSKIIVGREDNIYTTNLTMMGGAMRFVEILPNAGIHPTHIHSEPRNGDRSFVTVHSKFSWSGGTFRGNAEIGAHEGVIIGSGDFPESSQKELMRLEMLCNLVNYGIFYWYWGDIVMKEQANFVNSKTITIDNPDTHTGRIVNEFTEGFYKTYVATWEDNDASVHTDLGGFA